jgi:MtN3 and saliva related transmembrane protein|tara:strand:- start:2523 stop:2786 length:264 start_codon:yes stop_codon:yes gene_type:complete
MDLIFVIGTLAVIATGIRLLPQIVKSFKTKKVRDVSLLWEVIGGVGSILWLIYAYLREDMILLTAAIVLLISYGILIFQKFIYSSQK